MSDDLMIRSYKQDIYHSPFLESDVSSFKHQEGKDSIKPIHQNEQSMNLKIDTIEKNKESTSFFSRIAHGFSTLWNSIFGEKVQNEKTSYDLKTELSILKQDQKAKQHFNREMSEMYQRIMDINEQYGELLKENKENKEALIMNLLLLTVKNQMNLQENEGFVTMHRIESARGNLSHLSLSKIEVEEEMQKLTKRSDFMNAFDKAVTIVSAASMLVTFGVSFLNPAVASLIPTIQQLTQGLKVGNYAINGFTRAELETRQKKQILLNALKEASQETINDGYERLNNTTETISNIWALLKEISDKQRATTSNILRNT